MIELSVRLIVSGLLVLLSGWLGVPAFDVTWKVSIFTVATAIGAYQLEQKKLINPGTKGFIAAADSIAIAFLIAGAHQLDHLGFLALLPCAWAASRYGTPAAYTAPIGTAGLLFAQLLGEGSQPSPLLYAQAAGVLGLGLLLQPRKVIVETPVQIPRNADPLPDDYLELRESFRQMRDFSRDLERRSRKEHLTVQLYETQLPSGDRYFDRLSERIRILTGAESVSIYTIAQYDDVMVVRSTAGEPIEAIREHTVQIAKDRSAIQISNMMDKALKALLSDRERATVATVTLVDNLRTIGMINIAHPDPKRLIECRNACEELAPLVSNIIVEEGRKSSEKNRLRELEILYDVAVLTAGAATPESVAARLTRELKPIVDADHLAIYWLEGSEPLLVSVEGRRLEPFSVLTFGAGEGLSGWLKVGAPELLVHDSSTDSRVIAVEAFRQRIGSFCVIPIIYGEGPAGYFTAVCNQPGKLDLAQMETLRAVVSEFGQALSRLRRETDLAQGLVTPAEFQRLIGSRSGCLVYLETLRREQILNSCGRNALDRAVRQFSRRVRAKLPRGGALCRREAGDLVAFLPDYDESFARSWANDTAATAAMIGISNVDGSRKVPFAVRAKVAAIGSSVEVERAS